MYRKVNLFLCDLYVFKGIVLSRDAVTGNNFLGVVKIKTRMLVSNKI